MKLSDAVKPKRLKAGVYRVAGNLLLVETSDRCIRGVGHNRRGNATKKCVTWKLYRTSLSDAEALEALDINSRDLFGAVVVEEFESKAEAIRAVAAAIQKEA